MRTGREYIKVNWPVNNVLSYKRLSLTLSILLALASASRAIQIHFLDISHMGRLPDQYKFVYTKLHKNWRKGKSPPASVSLLIPSICTCVWWNVWILIWIEQRYGEMERTNYYWALFNLTRKCAGLLSAFFGWRRLLLSGVTKILGFGGHFTRSGRIVRIVCSRGVRPRILVKWIHWAKVLS